MHEIERSNEVSNRKILIHKIAKTIEFVFGLYEAKDLEADQLRGLRLLKLQFYAVHLPNKLKMRHLIASIDYDRLALKDKLVVFEAKQRSEELQSSALFDSSKGEDEFDLFSNSSSTQKRTSLKC